MFILFYSI